MNNIHANVSELTNILTWKNKQMSSTLLLTTSKFSWKLLVMMHHGSMERMKYTTEEIITWLEKDFLTSINIEANASVQHRHQHKSIDANSTVH